MKKSIILLVIILFSCVNAQITTTRINEFKIQTSKQDVEKIIGYKLILQPDEYGWMHYAEINYKGVDLKLGFANYTEIENDSDGYTLFEITTQSKNVKTLSGISVGDDIHKLWNTYYKDFNISLWNIWDEETETRSNNKKMFELSGNEEMTVIRFFINNGIITEIAVSVFEGC